MGRSDLGMPDTCGDGALQAEERCDPGLPSDSVGACPEACDDGDVCTEDTLIGAGTCDAVCAVIPITMCVSGDGCCPGDCTSTTDDDCVDDVVCGDGVVTGGELCDPQATGDQRCKISAAGCAPMECQTAALMGAASNCDVQCVYQPVAACTSGDGCCPTGCNSLSDSDCMPTCGNGVIEGDELCDATA